MCVCTPEKRTPWCPDCIRPEKPQIFAPPGSPPPDSLTHPCVSFQVVNIIHPTAIVSPRAILGKGNRIGPFCIIGPGVMLGDDNRLEAHVCLGTPPESRGHFDREDGLVRVGNGCTIREFVTVHGGVERATVLHDRVILMTKSHIGHDAVIESDVTVSCGALVGGHSHIMQGANLGLNSVIHQKQVIGSWAMVGAQAFVGRRQLVAPGWKVAGVPARKIGMNEKALLNLDNMELFRRDEERFVEIAKGFGYNFKEAVDETQPG